MKVFLFVILLIPSFANATDSKFSGWLGTFTKKKLDDTYSFWAETQLRHGIDVGSTNQILYRTGLLAKINDNHGVGFLYAYIQGGNNKEHRWTLQHTQKYGEWIGANFSHRARVEARFLEDDSDDAARFRYLLRADKVISKYNLVIWDEAFINLTDNAWTGSRTFDRNRFFLGLKHQFENFRVEWGYLNQFVPRETEDTIEHIVTLYAFF